MISERRILANRANAQKSTGPKTPAGKATSSMNGVRHGLCSTTFVLFNENLEEYTQLRDEFIARFGPRDQVELELIERMVHACWNLRRTWTMVNETLNLQMFRMEGDLAKRYADLAERSRAAAAFEELAKQPALPLLYRYEARQNTEYQRALKTWLELRKNVPLAPAGAPLPRPRTERTHRASAARSRSYGRGSRSSLANRNPTEPNFISQH